MKFWLHSFTVIMAVLKFDSHYSCSHVFRAFPSKYVIGLYFLTYLNMCVAILTTLANEMRMELTCGYMHKIQCMHPTVSSPLSQTNNFL